MTTSTFNEFERLLGNQTTPWFEYHLEMASEVLRGFAAADWRHLEERALSLSACVQERCAEAVGDLGSAEGVGVLTALLDSPHLDVAAISASQLDDLGVTLPASSRGRLEELSELLTAQRSTRASDVRRLIETLK